MARGRAMELKRRGSTRSDAGWATAVAACLLAGLDPAATAVAAQARASGQLPRVGLAVRDTAGGWCAEFVGDSTAAPLVTGSPVTIVFPEAAATRSIDARLEDLPGGECWTAFPQPRWIDYVAYRLSADEREMAPSGDVPAVGLIVAGEVAWRRDSIGQLRADLDGDGVFEMARRCAADEGEHFTLWSVHPDGRRVRRWHEYFDWGGFTDPTCGPGEDGTGDPVVR